MSVNIIVAVGNYVNGKGWPIGKNGGMLWHNTADLKWFKEMTVGHPVIMGRKTWESLPKALVDRMNIVVSKTGSIDVRFEDRHLVSKVESLEEGIEWAKKNSKEDIFIIGGASIYKYALENDLVDRVYIDLLAEKADDADTFFPDIVTDNDWEEEGTAREIEYRKAYAMSYVKLRGKNNHVDEQYLKLVNEIIENGEEKDTRAGKTHSLFAKQLRFNLKEGFPMLTTKKMFSKGVIYELLWFLKGDTNIKYLVDNNVHIWDDDAYRYYLELVKKHNEVRVKTTKMDWPSYKRDSIVPVSKEVFMERVKNGDKEWIIVNEKAFIMSYTPNNWEYLYQYGDLNRIYGAQWTNWGGHNQIQEVIDTLKTNPDDRRMIVSAWNVADIPDMALPPCHFCCQFYTKKMSHEERVAWAKANLNLNPLSYFVDFSDEDLDEHNVPTRKLSCMWHQRSVDSLLGLPFNIVSYSLLTYMIAQCVNMDVDELIFDGGDVHVYENQIETYEEMQKNRNPHMYALPSLWLNPDIKNIFDFKYDDIKIMGYESYPSIKYPLSTGLDKMV